MFGFKFGTQNKEREITLEDVTPLHPNDYPAKHLREILDSRRQSFSDIRHHYASEGLANVELTEA